VVAHVAFSLLFLPPDTFFSRSVTGLIENTLYRLIFGDEEDRYNLVKTVAARTASKAAL